MLNPKGQRPAPKISPFCVSLSANSICQSFISMTRIMNAKLVATSETKQVMKRNRSALEEVAKLSAWDDVMICSDGKGSRCVLK